MDNLPKIILWSGLLSTVFYMVADVVSGLVLPGYSFMNQTVSELSAVGVATRPFWVTMTVINNLLIIIMGGSIYLFCKRQTGLKIIGVLLAMWGIVNFGWVVFPMNQRGEIGSANDMMHLVMTGVTVMILLLMILGGAVIGGKHFRIYSILTLAMMAGFGIWTGIQAPKVAMNLSTYGMGITERASIYASLLWVSVLGVRVYGKRSVE